MLENWEVFGMHWLIKLERCPAGIQQLPVHKECWNLVFSIETVTPGGFWTLQQPFKNKEFSFFYLYSVFLNKNKNLVPGQPDKKNLPFNVIKPWAGPDLQGGTILLKANWVKGEK